MKRLKIIFIWAAVLTCVGFITVSCEGTKKILSTTSFEPGKVIFGKDEIIIPPGVKMKKNDSKELLNILTEANPADYYIESSRPGDDLNFYGNPRDLMTTRLIETKYPNVWDNMGPNFGHNTICIVVCSTNSKNAMTTPAQKQLLNRTRKLLSKYQ